MDGQQAAPALNPFAGETDDDLLGYMALRADDANSAKLAGAEFFTRHRGFLFDVLVKRGYGRLVGGDALLADLVQETFAKAFEGAGSYRSSGSKDPTRQRRACLAWLVGIAKHIYSDAHRRALSIVATANDDDLIDVPIDEHVVEAEEPLAVLAIREAFDKLTEREKDVVRVSMMHFKHGEEHQRMPSEAIAVLAKCWSTTPENLRAIRSRAFRKLKEHVEERLRTARKGKR